MSNNTLNKFGFQLLRWFCPDHLYEEIEGDLIQRFDRDAKLHGEKKANRRLFWNTLRFFRPGIVLRNKFSVELKQAYMIQNYLKTTVRHIARSKVNFAFKIGGLSLAMFSFLAIALYVSYQRSHDRHHYDYQNLYRVNSARKENGAVEKYATAPLAIGPMIKQNIPEVESYARIRFANGSYLRHEDKVVDCGGLIEGDSSFFHVLTYQFIHGNANALKEPNAIVLVKTKALELFGTTDVLQKIVSINHEPQAYQVTAVIEDPEKTCFGFEAIILNKTQAEFSLASVLSPVEFLDGSSTLFVRLKEPLSSSLETRIELMLDRYFKKSDREETGFSLSFQPISDIYLGPQLKAEFARKGNSVYVYAFSILGALLLLVATINYINLSIADFNSRSRETGIRKVLGARKHQLIAQVALETIVFSVFSFCIGLFALYLLFPQVTGLLESRLHFDMLLSKKLAMGIAIAFIALIFLSTWIPSRQFTRSGITQNLKAKGSGYNAFISQALMFTQFSISAICIACTLVAGQQVEFIHNKDLGIDRNNLIVFSIPEDFPVSKMVTLKQKIKEVAGVTSVSNSSFRISGGYWKDWYFVESKEGIRNVELYEVFSDDDIFQTLGIKLLEGRTFNADIPSDSGAAFIINETAARELGWENPIGKRIYTHPEEKGKWDGTVVGLVADVNISPLYDKIHPLVMRLPWQSDYPDYFVYVRYQGDEQTIIDAVGKKYQEVNPGYPFGFGFVDELYNRQHEKENRAFTSLQFSTTIIVLVSMLGIFSMAAFISMRRMKEFGIRKVLGASIQQIAGLHIQYFLRLAILSNFVALPIAYFLTQEWLDTFAYRVNLTYVPFLVVGIVLFILVVVSGSYSAWKSGRINPVDVIKMD